MTFVLAFLGSVLGAAGGYAAGAAIAYAVAGAMGDVRFRRRPRDVRGLLRGPDRRDCRLHFRRVAGAAPARQALVPRADRLCGGRRLSQPASSPRPYRHICISTLPRSIATARGSRSNSKSGCRRTRRYRPDQVTSGSSSTRPRTRSPGISIPPPRIRTAHAPCWSERLSSTIERPRACWRYRCRGEPDRIFKLPLAASPPPFEEFTVWTRVDLIGEPAGHPRQSRSGRGRRFRIRYRLPDPTSRPRISNSRSGYRPARGCRTISTPCTPLSDAMIR